MRLSISFSVGRNAAWLPGGTAFIAAALVGVLSASPAAHAQLVAPVSYDMNNGDSGAHNYWDALYNGSGSIDSDNAFLSGGTGFLTDGILPGPGWEDNLTFYPSTGATQPQNWVGWSSLVTTTPTVTFNLGAPTALSSVGFWLSNGTGGTVDNGGVSLPASIALSFSNDGSTFGSPIDYTVTPDGSDANARMITIGTPLTAQYVRSQFTYGSGWVFLGQAQFIAAAAPSATAPEPGTFALAASTLLPIAGIGLRRRCRTA